ncbi:hypothetical protein HK100_007812 [Physocladia obscura]|uniref:SH3 domain-containing protein n=1 Tax=Physocladia obscura TaxID=109957 RepID=A0AAD5T6Y9_9FUNG|nr:hypothetical protein HK100_007812 [Physocladia obscura]
MNSPLPQDVGSECRKVYLYQFVCLCKLKCGLLCVHRLQRSLKRSLCPRPKVLTRSFRRRSSVFANRSFAWRGFLIFLMYYMTHPPAQARGIAILSVIKAGFLFSGRGGSGLVVARLEDGSWSAPSAIGTAGFGAGGQIGVEITDFVIILNTADAVKAFSHGGNVTLGGNLSVAAGPIGRNAEASGSVLNLAPIYSYSVTKGLFVGISLEGSVIIERKETNAAFYRRKVSAKEILSGGVPPPPAAEELYRALNRRTEEEIAGGQITSKPLFSNLSFGRKPTETTSSLDRNQSPGSINSYGSHNSYGRPAPQISGPLPGTGRPLPVPAPSVGQVRVTAMYDFEGQRDGDLSFRAGEQIIVVQKNPNDWWTGRIGIREGVFPANYVQ